MAAPLQPVKNIDTEGTPQPAAASFKNKKFEII
jgi:hypothetical protein